MSRAIIFLAFLAFAIVLLTVAAYLYLSKVEERKREEREHKRRIDEQLFSEDGLDDDPIERELDDDRDG